MSFLDRIEQTGDPPYISAHTLNAVIQLWLLGVWNDGAALAALEDHLGITLTAGEQAAALEMKASYAVLTNAQKGEYLHRFEGATVALQEGIQGMTRALYKSLVGIVTE